MLLRYDLTKMNHLLKNFFLLTGTRIVVFDDAFKKIAEYPSHDSPFCSLIRTDPKALAQCLESDRHGCQQCKKLNRIYSYTCHAGLTEIIAPVRYRNIVIGYMMFGQVLPCDDVKQHWPHVWQRCQEYDVDKTELKEAYDQIHGIKNDQILASAQIMEACAGYLWLQRMVLLREDDLPEKIINYIADHIASDLAIKTLCHRFNISRSKLYNIAGTYYGKAMGQLIKELRIDKAKELLESSNDAVSEVAAQVGYSDYNYFIRVFKREVGMTPKQYALRCQRENTEKHRNGV
jgi:AraC-like DNA-binding protein